MEVIIAKLKTEPAVVIGLLVTALTAYVTAKGPGGIDTTGDIATIVAPFAGSIGIRQLVTPASATNIPEDVGDAESKTETESAEDGD